MKIKIIAIGKTDESYLQEGIIKFLQRINHYIQVDLQILPDVKQNSKLNITQLKEAEGKLILQKLTTPDYVVLLDDKGDAYSSEEFAGYLQKKMNVLPGYLIFIIGGPFGFSDQVYERANSKFSLSKLTFSHQMIRLFFIEQLYRAFTILKGEKYHHS